MKLMKFSALAMSVALLLSSCGGGQGLSNLGKGSLIGGGAGGAVGALLGGLISKNDKGKWAGIGAAVGTAVGAGTGALIGNKMDKAKKAAELAKAEAEILTGPNGVKYVKCTFDSGILFSSSSANLTAEAQASINKFITNLVAEDNTFDMAIAGYTDNTGWRNCTAEQSKQKNVDLSQSRAQSVCNQIVAAGYPSQRLMVKGLGEEYPVADNATAEGKAKNRRVEVYILPSDDMIKAVEAAHGTN